MVVSRHWFFSLAVLLITRSLCRRRLPAGGTSDSLSELAVGTRNFLPAVRDQVQRADEAALRNPKAAEATGELGMVLE